MNGPPTDLESGFLRMSTPPPPTLAPAKAHKASPMPRGASGYERGIAEYYGNVVCIHIDAKLIHWERSFLSLASLPRSGRSYGVCPRMKPRQERAQNSTTFVAARRVSYSSSSSASHSSSTWANLSKSLIAISPFSHRTVRFLLRQIMRQGGQEVSNQRDVLAINRSVDSGVTMRCKGTVVGD